MILFLLKSSACLAIFMLFYKLCLEKTSAHTFKRFYLITVILISIGIPFITITEYVEVQPLTTTFTPEFNTVMTVDMIETKSFKDYLSSILWSIYMLGIVLFSLRFFKNLYQLFQTIKKNPKFKNQNFINVLLKDLITPHTFFNYIFLNKAKYENHEIPKEVFIHEQTHAKQKHALDILFIEILQILFWFNPLLYLIKKDIKLNHEFLADNAVINKGVNTKQYQELLLAFSSNASSPTLANAINYSLIKKRFTVMKTNTSKTALRLRILIILPLLAILIYSFSDKKIISQLTEYQPANNRLNPINETFVVNDIYIIVDNQNLISLNDKPSDIQHLLNDINSLNHDLTVFQKRKFLKAMIEHQSNTSKDLIENIKRIIYTADIWQIGAIDVERNKNTYQRSNRPKLPFITLGELNEEDMIIYKAQIAKYKEWLQVNKPNRTLEETINGYTIKNKKGEVISSTDPSIESKPFELKKDSPWKITTGELTKVEFNKSNNSQIAKETVIVQQQKATPEQIAEYNKIVKKLNAQPENKRIIKQKDVERLKYIYGLMTKEQKENAETFPKLVPPPPPAMDTVYTYNRLAKRVQTNSKNRKANTIHLKEIYSKMSNSKKNKVNTPEVILKSIREDADNIANTPPSPPAPKKPKLIEIIEVKPPQDLKPNKEPTALKIKEIVEVPPPPPPAPKDPKPDQVKVIQNEALDNQTIDITPIKKPNSPWKITVDVNAPDLTLNSGPNTKIEIVQKDLDEYNSLAKKFNANPDGVFKAKDIKRVIELYNLMSDKQKKEVEPFPKFTPPPTIPENATPEEVNAHNKKYKVYKELTKDLKN